MLVDCFLFVIENSKAVGFKKPIYTVDRLQKRESGKGGEKQTNKKTRVFGFLFLYLSSTTWFREVQL